MNTIKATSQPWSLVVCGGGSGGHLFPALAVIEELRRRNAAPERILFLTAERPIDRWVLEEQGVEQHSLPAVNSHELLRKPFQSSRALLHAVWQARQMLRGLPSPVILGTGGFSSVPGVLAARWRKRPIMLLEQNVIPGRATSWLARFAQVIGLSFLETRQFLPASIRMEVTGNPVRRSIAMMNTSTKTVDKRLLVLGGSQGATAVNDGMLRFVQKHREQLNGWTIVHQTGVSDHEKLQQAYRELKQTADVAPYFENLPDLYGKASLIVTRAGGTSLAEIACAGRPAVLIPYPGSLRNHQLINARHFEGRGAAVLVEQRPAEKFDSALAKALLPLIEDPERRSSMATAMQSCAVPEAASHVCNILLSLTSPGRVHCHD